MPRLGIISLALFLAIKAATTAASGGDELRLWERAPEIALSFDGGDPQATAVARQIYGASFRWVVAQRIWLKAPDDGFEQMAAQLSADRDCSVNCLYAVLFYDDRNWLELWRGRATELQLGPVGPDGLRGIHDGVRLWRWMGGVYRPDLREYRFDYRAIKPQEKTSIETALKGAFGQSDPDARYQVLDLPLKSGTGALVSLSSLTFCGQSVCPVFVLDENAKILAHLQSMDGESGAALARDVHDNPLIETRSVRGVELYRIGDQQPVMEIRAQSPIIAGRQRQ